ncbi:unnamed protein product [marine sediment metagenome]|uniref:Uncharacterized protein n=1 Tax=marine sediment metagenome TaxID=412755 RepID=X1JR79_9ZZZZ
MSDKQDITKSIAEYKRIVNERKQRIADAVEKIKADRREQTAKPYHRPEQPL